MKRATKCVLLLLGLCAFCFSAGAQTLSKINGKGVACSAGNISALNGKTLGISSGNLSKVNGLNVPSCGAGSTQRPILVMVPGGQPLTMTPGGQSLVLQ